ncbi:hypothetical protein TSUD_250320 [Trifolium subterraneum]|nr:hypothetical protein TSUD_250320 [Trifolium subterraneum]
MVVGSVLQPEINESVETILKLINGIPFPNKAFGWVDVKDVARAHVNAYEIASASGRYCLADRVISKEKAKSLGMEFTPLEVSLKETGKFQREKDSRLLIRRDIPLNL